MYTFTASELEDIQWVMETSGIDAPRAAYRFYNRLTPKALLRDAQAVEDFVVEFMTAYNRQHPNTY